MRVVLFEVGDLARCALVSVSRLSAKIPEIAINSYSSNRWVQRTSGATLDEERACSGLTYMLT